MFAAMTLVRVRERHAAVTTIPPLTCAVVSGAHLLQIVDRIAMNPLVAEANKVAERVNDERPASKRWASSLRSDRADLRRAARSM